MKVLNEAKILSELSENNCPPVQIQFLLRAHPLVIESKKILKSGEIGRLLALDGIFTGWKRMRPDSSILENDGCLLYTSPSPRDQRGSRMPAWA